MTVQAESWAFAVDLEPSKVQEIPMSTNIFQMRNCEFCCDIEGIVVEPPGESLSEYGLSKVHLPQ